MRARLYANHMGRGGHRLLGGLPIAVFVLEGEVVGHLIVDAHGARGVGLRGLDEHRQVLVFDLDEFGGVLRDVLRLGNNHDNRLADEAHALMRQPVSRRNAQ